MKIRFQSANGLLGVLRSRIEALTWLTNVSNCFLPNGPCVAVLSSKQVRALQQAPPPFMNTMRFLLSLLFTAMPVGVPSLHAEFGKSTQVHVFFGASMGSVEGWG